MNIHPQILFYRTWGFTPPESAHHQAATVFAGLTSRPNPLLYFNRRALDRLKKSCSRPDVLPRPDNTLYGATPHPDPHWITVSLCGFRVDTNRSSVRSSNAFVVRTSACRPDLVPTYRAVYPCLVLMQFPHVDPEDLRTTVLMQFPHVDPEDLRTTL